MSVILFVEVPSVDVQKKIQELEMKAVIRDLSVYFVYVSIIFIISYGNRDPNAYLVRAWNVVN